MPQSLVETARRKPDATFLRVVGGDARHAPVRLVTFAEFERGVRRAAAFLRGAGVLPGDRVLLFADNSAEWQEISLAAQLLRAEPAALFAHLSAEQARGLALRVRPRVLFVSSVSQWDKLAPQAVALAAGGLRSVLFGEPLGRGPPPAGLGTATTAEVLAAPGAPEIGPSELVALARAGHGEDPFILVFTSGTTGRFKGVRLPQRAMMNALRGGWDSTGRTEDDLGLHFLPFGHIAGHDHFMLALAQGHGLIMVARRDDIPRALALGPTYLFAVPLVYERIRDEVRARIAALPAPLRAIASAALAAAARVKEGRGGGRGDLALSALARRFLGRPLRAGWGKGRGPVLGRRGHAAGALGLLRGPRHPLCRALRDERDGRPHLLEPLRGPAPSRFGRVSRRGPRAAHRR